ncbi:MAG: hypothetical protein WA982_15480 [Rubrobacteraceae bacterium]
MPTSTDSHKTTSHERAVARPDDTADPRWSWLYKIGGVAALIGVALIPVQIVVFAVWPPPTAAVGFFELFELNWLLGLLSLDLLYLLQNVLLVLIYLSLYVALHRINEPLMAIALALGLVGIASYFPSNTAFEMLDLSTRYAGAETEAQRAALLAAGEGMLATYVGTAFDVYYVLNAIALLIIAAVMLQSGVFGRVTAYVGLLAGLLMSIPSTAGTIGLVFALASLLPWAVFSVLVARRLLRLARGTTKGAANGS